MTQPNKHSDPVRAKYAETIRCMSVVFDDIAAQLNLPKEQYGDPDALLDKIEELQAAIAHERQLADELAEALARASRCQFQRYYRRGDGSSYLAGDDDTEYFVKIALAKHQAARGM